MAPARETRTRLTPAPLPQAPLDAAQRLACLRLIRSDNVGPVTFRELDQPLRRRRGGARGLARAFAQGRPARKHSGSALATLPRPNCEAAEPLGARPLFTIEPGYPPALAAVEVPPPLLYAKGNIGHLSRPMVAIVGARNGSAAGQKLTRMFASELGAAGFVIASGLARGIDAAAHEAALDTGTVAVLAGGIDIVYPPENAALQREIGERGCLVTREPAGLRAPRAGLPAPQPHHLRASRLGC